MLARCAAQASLRLPSEPLLAFLVMCTARTDKVCRRVLRVWESEPLIWAAYAHLLYEQGQMQQGRSIFLTCVRMLARDVRLLPIVATWTYLEMVNQAMAHREGHRPRVLLAPYEGGGVPSVCLHIWVCFTEGTYDAFTYEDRAKPSQLKILSAISSLKRLIPSTAPDDGRMMPVCTASFFACLFGVALLTADVCGPAKCWEEMATHLPDAPKDDEPLACCEVSRSLELCLAFTLDLVLCHPQSSPSLLKDVCRTALRHCPFNAKFFATVTRLHVRAHQSHSLRLLVSSHLAALPPLAPLRLQSPYRQRSAGERSDHPESGSDTHSHHHHPITHLTPHLLYWTIQAEIDRGRPSYARCADECERQLAATGQGGNAAALWDMYLNVIELAIDRGRRLFDALPPDNDLREQRRKVCARAVQSCPYSKRLWLRQLVEMDNRLRGEQQPEEAEQGAAARREAADEVLLDAIQTIMDKEVHLTHDPLTAMA